MKVLTCPGCRSGKYVELSRSGALTESRNNIDFVQNAYAVNQCNNCGLYYKDEVLSEKEFKVYYNSFDFNQWSDPRNIYPTEEIIKKQLGKAIWQAKEKLKILDFGCSDGRLLHFFAEQSFCFGFDIDERIYKTLSEKGIEGLTSKELEDKDSYFDLIIISDVFEHLLHPTVLIQQVWKKLAPGGKLIISTGFADSDYCRFDIADYWYFKNLQHVCMLGNRYIDFLAATLRAKVVLRKECSHYSASFMKKAGRKTAFSIRFFLYKHISTKKSSRLNRIVRKVPFLNKIVKWNTQPFYPFAKDHIVTVFEKMNP
ncbi:class I SAM-dependent methyltransferase [Sediminibacterium ginsengisoli]|uniref:Methyltransferase domain-containing protein n=1 Tax=Sediminibacterium ginsengisoli TaxID=413434 RepID=A0A1T4Q5W4_9BACT|nr:class I SAM-dependent methyltransferase [Sediminibacterium ginsengisoli]SJZ99163.1 Methyltransferase domain-containing protein [Sediminibacterium ginsengisoli]